MIKLIALDLEGTLISNAVSVFPRPGLRDFLHFCMSRFERVAIFSSVPEARCRAILQLLDGEGLLPPGFQDRIEIVTWSGATKDFGFIGGVDRSEVLLIDDQERVVAEMDKANWILCEEFLPPYSDSVQKLYEVMRQIEG